MWNTLSFDFANSVFLFFLFICKLRRAGPCRWPVAFPWRGSCAQHKGQLRGQVGAPPAGSHFPPRGRPRPQGLPWQPPPAPALCCLVPTRPQSPPRTCLFLGPRRAGLSDPGEKQTTRSGSPRRPRFRPPSFSAALEAGVLPAPAGCPVPRVRHGRGGRGEGITAKSWSRAPGPGRGPFAAAPQACCRPLSACLPTLPYLSCCPWEPSGASQPCCTPGRRESRAEPRGLLSCQSVGTAPASTPDVYPRAPEADICRGAGSREAAGVCSWSPALRGFRAPASPRTLEPPPSAGVLLQGPGPVGSALCGSGASS